MAAVYILNFYSLTAQTKDNYRTPSITPDKCSHSACERPHIPSTLSSSHFTAHHRCSSPVPVEVISPLKPYHTNTTFSSFTRRIGFVSTCTDTCFSFFLDSTKKSAVYIIFYQGAWSIMQGCHRQVLKNLVSSPVSWQLPFFSW